MSETNNIYFLDTDIGPDCDDTAALAILISLCRRTGSRLAGITHCTGSPYGLATIDAICRGFGISVPLGTCPTRGFLSGPDARKYTEEIAARFEHSYPPDQQQPDARETLVKAFTDVPQGSVTLITIGPLNNLACFLREKKTEKLLHEKVKRIVCMAGCFNGLLPGAEWNVEMDILSAHTVAEKWEGQLDFCPFEAFADVMTGGCLSTFPNNPITTAYRLFTEGGMKRPSWDPGTVAAAVLGAQPPFAWSENGNLRMDARGKTFFTPSAMGRFRYLKRIGTAHEAERQLEKLLAEATGEMKCRLQT